MAHLIMQPVECIAQYVTSFDQVMRYDALYCYSTPLIHTHRCAKPSHLFFHLPAQLHAHHPTTHSSIFPPDCQCALLHPVIHLSISVYDVPAQSPIISIYLQLRSKSYTSLKEMHVMAVLGF